MTTDKREQDPDVQEFLNDSSAFSRNATCHTPYRRFQYDTGVFTGVNSQQSSNIFHPQSSQSPKGGKKKQDFVSTSLFQLAESVLCSILCWLLIVTRRTIYQSLFIQLKNVKTREWPVRTLVKSHQHTSFSQLHIIFFLQAIVSTTKNLYQDLTKIS